MPAKTLEILQGGSLFMHFYEHEHAVVVEDLFSKDATADQA